MRIVAMILLAAGIALSACSSTSTPTTVQSVYAAEQAYTTAAHAEVLVGPRLSAANLAAMQKLDTTAYAALVPLRTAAQTGSLTAVQIQAATDAVTALSAFIATKQ